MVLKKDILYVVTKTTLHSEGDYYESTGMGWVSQRLL